jgi:hypothetical protein
MQKAIFIGKGVVSSNMFKKLSKQDRQGVRQAKDVERKYNLGEVVQTVRVVQESSIPNDVLGNYYTKVEIDYKTIQLKEELESQIPNGDYRIVDDIVEWYNPPMELDTEYRTTERWLGKPVYTKAVMQDVSSRGSSDEEKDTYYQIELPTSTPNFDKCIRYSGHTTGWSHITLPHFSSDDSGNTCHIALASMSDTMIYVQVHNKTFIGGANLYIQVWYTKAE